MSEDNKQLEVNLGNQVEETDEVSAENFSNPDDQQSATSSRPQSNEQVFESASSTTQTNEATTDNVQLDTEKILSVLAEQLQSNEPARELLSQLQQIIATLTQNQENLLQTNETLSEQIEEENQKIEAQQRRYVGLVAEFDNFRKRTQREKEDLEKQAKRKTLGELLAVVDNFERARLQIKPANEGEMEIHKSYQGVYKNLVESLKRLGVSAMRPEGEPFDPMYHEAMLREPTDEYPEGTVIEQLVRGYLLEDQVLRHAMVKVAAPKEVETDATETTESTKEAQESTP